MKKVIFLLFLLCIQLAEASSIYDSLSSEISINYTFGAEIISKSIYTKTEEVSADILVFPKKDVNQELIDISTTPKAEIGDEKIFFKWHFPKNQPLAVVSSKVKVSSNTPKVFSKQEYPLKALIFFPDDVRDYLYPTKNVDYLNEDISKLARKLSEEEDDEWVIASKLAIWVKENVNYELDSITAPVSQNASWVLNERRGVCDEVTSLFIALLRSLNIPARFVHGVVYTDEISQKWAPHVWAEVYFPEYGWVPFDVTFGQFGWVDNSHIKFMFSRDSVKEGYKFSWRGKDAELKVFSLLLAGELIGNSGDYGKEAGVDLRVFQERIGFNSYNLVEAGVSNTANYYQTIELTIADVKELEFLDGRKRYVILSPGEFKKFFFTVKTKNLSSDFSYEIPVQLSTGRNQTVVKKIVSTARDISYSQSDITKALAFATEEQEKEYSKRVELSCIPDVKEFYDDRYVNVKCVFKNNGYEDIKGLQVCLMRQCRGFDVGKNNFIETKFTFDVSRYGRQDVLAVARNDQVSTNSRITVEKLDKPLLKITDLKYPKILGNFTIISFNLTKESYSSPRKVNVSLKFNNKEFSRFYDSVIVKQQVEFTVKNEELASGDNNFRLRVYYRDAKDRESVEKENFIITKGENWFYRAFEFLKDFLRSLKDVFV